MSVLLISSWFTKLSIWASGVEPRATTPSSNQFHDFLKPDISFSKTVGDAIMSTWFNHKTFTCLLVLDFTFSVTCGFLNLQFHIWWYANLSVQILEDHCNLLYILFCISLIKVESRICKVVRSITKIRVIDSTKTEVVNDWLYEFISKWRHSYQEKIESKFCWLEVECYKSEITIDS